MKSEHLNKVSDFLHRLGKATTATGVALDPCGELYLTIVGVGSVGTVKVVNVDGVDGEDISYELERLI